MKLKHKVVVVTGSTRGIGRAIVQACAREGANVVVCSRRDSAVRKTIDELKKQGLKVSGISADVSNQDDLEKLFKHALNAWGRIDVWINNAGLSGGYLPLAKMNKDEIKNLVDVNLTGMLEACRMVIPYFIEQGGGILINMAGKGWDGKASPYTTAYAATKAAVASLTRSLAKENKAYPISIHAVVPGMVKTDMYRDIKTTPGLEKSVETVSYVLKAIGVQADVVGHSFVQIAAQEAGKTTGKVYSLFKGWRLVRGIALLTWYRLTGKIKTTE